MTDAIEVMNNDMLQLPLSDVLRIVASGGNGAELVNINELLIEAADMIDKQQAERDGIRAAAFVEAADEARRDTDENGSVDIRPYHEIADAILALAGTPTGMVCVPVDEAPVNKYNYTSKVLLSEDLKAAEKHCEWMQFKHAWNAVMNRRAMTAQRSE